MWSGNTVAFGVNLRYRQQICCKYYKALIIISSTKPSSQATRTIYPTELQTFLKMRITIATTLFLLPLLTSAAPYQCDTHALLKLTPIDVSYFFEYSTPAHVSRKSGNINFTLTNDQVDEPTQCTGSSQLDFGHFYGFQMFECTPPGTLFSFDSSTNVVGLNMTWTCQE
jgi:hypothetical protein